MLMCLRNYKQALWRGQVNDFSLEGLMGREMKDLTVGIVGAGRIGCTVMQNLSGFGCRMLYNNQGPNEHADLFGAYADLDTLFSHCDVISLHAPLTPQTRHLVNRESIAKMRDGVVIVNCARGELADLDALVEGIESGKIGALGIDTAEGEEGIIHQDRRTDIIANRNWFYLRQFRNVVMTQHMAFYTDSARRSMVKSAVLGICAMAAGEPCTTQLC